MKFTQFFFPNARRFPVTIGVPEEIELLAKELDDNGWRFEIECFPDTQIVNMDCCDNEGQLANAICKNGPSVPSTVQDLVRAAHASWLRKGKPKAK
jgi:hypothetical protein